MNAFKTIDYAIANQECDTGKHKLQHVNRNTLTTTILTMLFMICPGCEQQTPINKVSIVDSDVNNTSIMGINSEEFLFTATEQGGDITFSSKDFDHCRLSFIKNKMKPGYHTRAEAFGEGEIDLTCLRDKKLYSMSPVTPTFIDMVVTELNDKAISILLNFTLHSIRTRESLTKNDFELIIEGDNLKKLFTQE